MLIPPPLAIDLGDRTIKIAQFAPRQRWHAGYPFPRLQFLIERDLQEGWVTQGTLTDPAALAVFIRRAINERVSLLSRSPFVVSALPERQTFLTTVTVPADSVARRDEAMRQAVSAAMPVAVEQATFSNAAILGTTDRVAVAAAPTALIESYAAFFERLRLTPIALVTEAEALACAVAYVAKHVPAQNDKTQITAPVIILDLGATRTGAIIANNNSIASSITIPVSGMQLTAAIAAKLRIDPAAAERAKRGADLTRAAQDDTTATAITAALEPIISGVASLRAFAQHHLPTALQPNRIVLTGGGSQLRGLDAFLKQRCRLEITTFVLPPASAPPVTGHTATPTSRLALVFGLGLMTLDPTSCLYE